MSEHTDKQRESIVSFWQRILADDEIPVQNRMKASELLYRSLQQEQTAAKEEVELAIDRRIELSRAIIEKYAGKSAKGGKSIAK